MRGFPTVVGLALMLAIGACERVQRLTVDEYASAHAEMTAELQALGAEFSEGVGRAVDMGTGEVTDESSLREQVASVVDEIHRQFERLSALVPPESLEAEHDMFVQEANARAQQWAALTEPEVDLSTIDALAAATAKSAAFTAACTELEDALAREGVPVDLDCE
jgi:hypothetical protein